MVPDVAVLDGPLVGDLVVGKIGQHEYVDDDVSEQNCDIVCGLYIVDETARGSIVSHRSWWPKQTVWELSGLSSSLWLPDAESWFIKRSTFLRENGWLALNSPALYAANEWRDGLKFHKAYTDRIAAGVESFSLAAANEILSRQ